MSLRGPVFKSSLSGAPRARLDARTLQSAAQAYELVAYVATGAFADVWQVRHRQSGECRAWKQLQPQWEDDRTARRLFENEVEVGSQIASPFIPRVLQAQVDRKPRYMVLEWHPGQTLERRLEAESRLPVDQALWIARQCAQGLNDLLQAGFTHGDVKPANILVGTEGALKLLDLGFARAVVGPRGDEAPRNWDVLTGTPEYLAPEALQRVPTRGAAKDMYSLGVTLYRMLTGRLPFQADTAADVLKQQRSAIPHPLRYFVPEVSRELAELVDSLLAKQPLRRPASYAELIDRLIGAELSTLREAASAAS
jgi:serine/threonine-protein kinase